jgi:hypothetical protein
MGHSTLTLLFPGAHHPHMNLLSGMHIFIPMVVVPLLSTPSLSRDSSRPPLAACSLPICDFGTRNNRDSTNHVFVIENKGDQPLVISQVRSGCGCTQTVLSTNTIAPGTAATLRATLNLRGYAGPKRVSIYLHTNDPSHPVLQCQFTGIAVPDMEITPHDYHMTAVASQFPLRPLSITVANKTSSPLNIKGLSWRGTAMPLEVTTNDPGRSYTLVIGPFSKPDAATIQSTLILATDHPLYPGIEIPGSISLAANLKAYPAELMFRTATPPADPRYLVIRSTNRQPFTILSVSASNTNLPCSVQSKKPDWARIRVGPFPAGIQLAGTIITIRTDLQEGESVEVPLIIETQQ